MPKNAATGIRPYSWSSLDPAGEAAGPPVSPEPPLGAVPSGAPVQSYRWSELGGEGGPGREAADAARGDEILAEARRQAEQLLSDASEEVRRLADTARREGLEAGRTEGRAALEEAAGLLFGAAEELAGYKEALFREARGQVVELSLALVNRVLGPLAARDEAAVVRVVERALQLLSDRETLTLRVHPDDLRSLVEAKPRVLESFDGIQKLTVLDDPAVKRGGCLVQTPTAEIDARLDSQLAELARSLRSS